MWTSSMMMGGKVDFDPSMPLGTFIEGGYYIGNIVDGGKNYALFLAPKSTGQNNSLQWKTTNTSTPNI